MRVNINTGKGINAYQEGQRVAERLFRDCPGHVSDEIVLALLRMTKAESDANPGTGAAHHSPAIAKLLKAIDS